MAIQKRKYILRSDEKYGRKPTGSRSSLVRTVGEKNKRPKWERLKIQKAHLLIIN